MIRAAILDRDGVINRDTGYVGNPDDFELLPGVVEALSSLAEEGFRLVVVTNQSGIGRGYFTQADYARVTAKMISLLGEAQVHLDAIEHCPHAPDEGCLCRKPKPGMIWSGLAKTGADAGTSILFGDKPSDIEAGRAAGIGLLCLIGTPSNPDAVDANLVAPDLLAAVNLSLSSLGRR